MSIFPFKPQVTYLPNDCQQLQELLQDWFGSRAQFRRATSSPLLLWHTIKWQSDCSAAVEGGQLGNVQRCVSKIMSEVYSKLRLLEEYRQKVVQSSFSKTRSIAKISIQAQHAAGSRVRAQLCPVWAALLHKLAFSNKFSATQQAFLLLQHPVILVKPKCPCLQIILRFKDQFQSLSTSGFSCVTETLNLYEPSCSMGPSSDC